MYGLGDMNATITATMGIPTSAARDARSTPQRDCTNDPDAEVIAAASAASIPKPSPRRAPVKQMKAIHGKRMAQEERHYLSTDGAENESVQVTSDSEDGEKVESPVQAKRIRSTPTPPPVQRSRKSHAKRRRSSDASSRSSSASSVERSPKNHHKKHAPDDKRPVKPSSRSHRTKNNGNGKKRSVVRTEAVNPTEAVYPVVTHGGHAPSQAPKQPSTPINEQYTNVIFDTIMKEKQSQGNREMEPDAASRVTSVVSKRSQRRAPKQRKCLDLETLQKYLPDGLVGNELSMKTVKMMYELYKNVSQGKNGHLIESVRSITYIPIESNDTDDRMQINGKNYLFCAYKTEFGNDYVSMERSPKLIAQSLLTALRPKCNTKKHSLDLVFRQALKELCEEIHSFEEDGDVSLENPVHVSGRYLELRVLQNIKSAYSKYIGEDILKYLTDSCPDHESPLRPLVEESTCEMYIRKLLDRYDLRPANFDKSIAEVPITPQNMRVWTDTRSQSATNVVIANRIQAAYKELSSEWASISEDEKKNRSLYREFSVEYAKIMKTFMKTNDHFLADMMKASELMAWMCFGVTTNSATLGTVTMAAHYMTAKSESEKDRTNPQICWNYPLASLYRREPSVTTSQPVFTVDEYLTGLEEVIENAPEVE